ncbi:MAG: Ig-like domain-containing protein, partial [Chloroflexota bacterium]|nr:Ig-like domain-containing protein [Chloroflexota bacterium]
MDTGGTPPTNTPSPGSTSGTNPDEGAWAGLELPPLPAVADLEATKGNGAVVAADTAFRLTSRDGTPVAELAKRLEVQPALGLRAEAPSGDSVTLRPKDRLRAGQPYRFTLRRSDGSIARAWTVTAAKALRIVGSIPGDQTDGVPRTTGIEVTFDQAGVTAAAMKDHFSISPKASGRFEVHGRTVAFVPAKPLKARTVYTVTVTKGVPLSGTGQSLGADYRFQFETKGTGPEVGLRPFDLLTDTAVRDAPVVLAYFWDDKDDGKTAIPKTVPVTVHRLDGLTAATAAYTKLANAPDWTRSAGAPIATSQLTRVLKADLRTHRIVDEEGGVREAWLRLPDPLARGWYVLTLTYGGAKSQVLLQVTDLAAYAMVTTSKTVVWVNSVRSGRPVAGATVSLSGTSLGRTDEDGLRVAVTPASFADSRHVTTPFVTVRDADGREVFLPIGGGGLCGKCDTGMISDGGSAAADAWWSVLMLDRQTLRSTDRANVWGIVRARDGGALPASVEIRLIASESWEPAGATPVVVERPRLAPTGMFTADIEFADVPVGYYQLELRANGETIENTWVQVGPIVKPAYTLEVTV